MTLFADTTLAARIERAESDLIRAGAEAIAAARADADVFVRPLAGGVAVYTCAGSPLNKLAGVGLEGLPSDDDLEEVERAFAQRGVPVQAEVSTLAQPAIFELLGRRGYRLVGFEAVLGREGGEDCVEPDCEIEIRAIEPSERDCWFDVVMTGFLHPDSQGIASHEKFSREVLEPVMRDFAATPGMRQYLASRDGRPVGGASMRITDGVAQFCGAATLPEYRRRGVQTALLNHRLRDMRGQGADLAVITTQPGSKSMQNAQRHGFQPLYNRAVLVANA